MAIPIRRREVIVTLGGTVAWPLAAWAQQPTMPVIGVLSASVAYPTSNPLLTAFRQGLSDTGYTVGENVAIEYRWAEEDYDQLPALAADLVQRNVRVIASLGSTPATIAAKAATTKIPIVFVGGVDPVKLGLVGSLNRPGGNLTGVSFLASLLPAKQFELLLELVPKAGIIGFLANPNFVDTEAQSTDVRAAAEAYGRRLVVLKAGNESEIDAVFSTIVTNKIDALLVQSEPLFWDRREQLTTLAAKHGIPAMYQLREFALAGGLISYGANLREPFWIAGVYTGRILKGEKVSDLPVQLPTKLELVINMKSAQMLGLDVPQSLITRADEVIE